MMNNFVFTCGDINGIGPEIVIKALNHLTQKRKQDKFYFICPANIFTSTLTTVKAKFKFSILSSIKDTPPTGQVTILKLPDGLQKLGYPTKTSGEVSFQALRLSYKLLKSNFADAVVTAPVSKTALKLAGINFPGQTEIYAKWCGVKDFAMTFYSKNINVALYSIHIPLKDVSKQLNSSKLKTTVKIISDTLKSDFRIVKPKTAILGLNPHAGETGIIGDEEKKIIEPFIKKYSIEFNLSGPFSPDAFFANKLYLDYDMVLGMYHDQVLIPFKFINQVGGVNYSAGLPIVRTSPDHGVAYDIAGKNIADPSSIIEAFYIAEKIVKNRKRKDAYIKK